MRKIGKIGLCALSLVMLALPAGAESSLSGAVVADGGVSVESPYGGVVQEVAQEGSVVGPGDSICTVSGDEVLSPVTGTVTGVFAAQGDDLDTAVNRYGAVLYIMPNAAYTVSASTSGAYSLRENRYITIGETVYLRGTSDATQTGVGRVTGVNGTNYTVEVTEGSFTIGASVTLYRSEEYTAVSRIGKGSVARAQAVAVAASGSLLRIAVEDGDAVQAGDVLFETVTGGLESGATGGATQGSGIVTDIAVAAGDSVEKGQTLGHIVPYDALRLEVNVPESELTDFLVGSVVSIEFLWNGEQVPGTVEFLSAVGVEDESGNVVFRALISFDAGEDVRLGMTAVVSAGQEE